MWASLCPVLTDVDLARIVVPIQSATGRVAELALAVRPNRCHGNFFRKESDDASSSGGGFLELPGFLSVQTPLYSPITHLCVLHYPPVKHTAAHVV